MKKESKRCHCCGKKNTYEIKKRLEWNLDSNYFFQLCPSKTEIAEIVSELQTCHHCNYTFINLEEDTPVRKWMLKTEEFHPNELTGNILKAHQVALIMQSLGAFRFAVQWNLYCAVLLTDSNETDLAKSYYKKAFILMERINNNPENTKTAGDFILLLNIMRLSGMFQTVISLGNQNKYSYKGIERKLIEKLIDLARNERNEYIAFYDLLID